MDMTPTRRSKRKSKSIYANPVESSQHKSHKIVKGLKVRRLNGISSMEYDSDELWEQCINSMIPHNWYRILPLHSNECDDLALSCGQSWQLLCPLRVGLGYLEEIASELNVVVSRLTSLTHTFTSVHKLHISYTRLAGEKIQHCMCLGKPVFTGPIKQNTAVRKNKFAIAHLRYPNRQLTIALQNHVDGIKQRKHNELLLVNQGGIMTLDNNNEKKQSTEATIPAILPPTILPPLSTIIEDEINVALSLDLLHIPCPSRFDPSFKIPIKRKQSTSQSTKLIVLLVAKIVAGIGNHFLMQHE